MVGAKINATIKKNMTKQSRLARIRRARDLRRAALFALLTMGLGLVVIFLGIPALIRLAILVGNWRTPQAAVENQDNLAPAPPRFKPPVEATFSAQIKLEGLTEPEATVRVFKNDQPAAEATADTDGAFLVDQFSLEAGINEIYAVAVDQAGNESRPSARYEIVFDDEPPEITITKPSPLVGFFTNQDRVEISGQINEEASVMINDRLVILEPQNTFSYEFYLQEGDNKIMVTAKDKAGNQSQQELVVTRG